MIGAIENESGESDGFVKYADIPDYISYDSPKVKLDKPEIWHKSRVPDEGMKPFIEDGKKIKFRPLAEHIWVENTCQGIIG